MEYPDYVEVGHGTYMSASCKFQRFHPQEFIKIGKWCSIAHNVEFLVGGGHNWDLVSTYPFDSARTYRGTDNIRIGNDVWIGTGAKILGGTELGNGCVVAAYSVVRGYHMAYSVLQGNPAEARSFRFPSDIRHRLEHIAWWNWPPHVVMERIEWFYKPVKEFIREFTR